MFYSYYSRWYEKSVPYITLLVCTSTYTFGKMSIFYDMFHEPTFLYFGDTLYNEVGKGPYIKPVRGIVKIRSQGSERITPITRDRGL